MARIDLKRILRGESVRGAGGFQALAGLQRGFGAGALEGRKMSFAEFQAQKRSIEDLIATTGAAGRLTVGEEPASMEQIIRAIRGDIPEGLRIVSRGAITPYKQSLKEHREWLRDFRTKALAQKVPRNITLAMQTGDRLLKLSRGFEDTDPTRADLYLARAEEHYTKAADLSNVKYGLNIPDIILEEQPKFEFFGIAIGKKKVITKRKTLIETRKKMIRVRKKTTGEKGTIPIGEFNSKIYERIR